MGIDCLMASSEEELDYGTDNDSEKEQPIRITDVRSESKNEANELLDKNNYDINAYSEKSRNMLDNESKKVELSACKTDENNNIIAHKAEISESSTSHVSFASTDLDETASSVYSVDEDYSDSQLQDVIFWILTQHVKNSCKLKRQILYSIGGLTGQARQVKTKFLNEVKEKLSFIFGFDLQEGNKNKGYLFLFNQLEFPLKTKKSEKLKIEEHNLRPDSKLKIEKFECSSRYEQELKCSNGLLFVILSLIFMSPGNTIDELGLDMFLMKIGLLKDKSGKEVNKEITNLFGKSPKEVLMKQWINAKYIEVTPIRNSKREASYEYKWGERANLEISKADVLKHVAKTYEIKESAFKEQYEQVYPN